MCCYILRYGSFNTQPPEGGWQVRLKVRRKELCFNTQPPEGGWETCYHCLYSDFVSTHSRLKAAGYDKKAYPKLYKFQHTAA